MRRMGWKTRLFCSIWMHCTASRWTYCTDWLACWQEASQEWIKAVGHATQIGLAASAPETEDFLAAIDRLGIIERQADDAERELTASAMQNARDFRELHLFTAIGGQLEAASDAMRHASLILARPHA